jgi:hypothetical protein
MNPTISTSWIDSHQLNKGMVFMKLALAAPLFITAAIIAVAHADIPIIPKDELQKSATHIVVGTVKLIGTEDENDGKFIHRTGVVEIKVSQVEKGEKIEAGDAVYARFWTQAWIGKGNPPPFGPGHHLPKKGDTVRVYLEKKEGGYDALLPNGFEVIPKPSAAQEKS